MHLLPFLLKYANHFINCVPESTYTAPTPELILQYALCNTL
jgi:hypothetical protein